MVKKSFVAIWVVIFAGGCMYDAEGPSKEQREALRTELVFDLQNFSPHKKIKIVYADAGGSHTIDYSVGLKTSLAGSAVVGIDLQENTFHYTASVTVKGSAAKNCPAGTLSKEKPRAICRLSGP